MSDALIPYLSVVVGLALILLMLAFRSILIPLTAIGGFLLTIGASFGAVVTVFQDGFGASLLGVAEAGPIVSILPVIVIGVLFGLAMDYQVFLVSRMREEFKHGATPDRRRARRVPPRSPRGHRRGPDHDRRLLGLHRASDDPIIKSVGFAFAFGIMVDAFLDPDDAHPGAHDGDGPPRLVAARPGSTGSCPTSTSRGRPSTAGRR